MKRDKHCKRMIFINWNYLINFYVLFTAAKKAFSESRVKSWLAGEEDAALSLPAGGKPLIRRASSFSSLSTATDGYTLQTLGKLS